MNQRLVLRGLRIRLILLMTLVLFPLGLIAIWQTYQLAQNARQVALGLLYEATEAAASDQRAVIQRTVGAAFGLGAVARQSGPETCRSAMRAFVRDNPRYAFAGYIPRDGLMTCSSSDNPEPVDFSGLETFDTALERADVFVDVNSNGTVSGESVIVVSVPVIEQGRLLGLMSVSLKNDQRHAADPERLMQNNLSVIGISTAGDVVDMSFDRDNNTIALPAGVALADLRKRAAGSFVAQDQAGEARMFSVHEAAGDAFVMVGSVPLSVVPGQNTPFQTLAPALFAVLMWFASMAVASYGLDRLVLRHLASVRSAMRRFALGERNNDGLTLDDAPEEFEDAARAFSRMALIITEAEAQQMTDLHDKEVLLREVHHRVKNNLQMIASIMNLQLRGAHSDEVREMLESLKGRVRALATLHRSLYSEVGTAQVDARDLIAAVVAETETLAPVPDLRIDTALDPVALYPDQAVPLSMWATEALTNAVKYVGAAAGDVPRISVSLTVDDEKTVVLCIENTLGADAGAADADSTGLGTTLMTAFCRQLEGSDAVERHSGRYERTLRFAVEAFQAEGEPADRDHVAA